MTKRLHLVIETCKDCPYFMEWGDGQNMCGEPSIMRDYSNTPYKIPLIEEIPQWCPLDDISLFPQLIKV